MQTISVTINIPIRSYQDYTPAVGADPEFRRRRGTLLKKKLKSKKKGHNNNTIITSYPLPNIYYITCVK